MVHVPCSSCILSTRMHAFSATSMQTQLYSTTQSTSLLRRRLMIRCELYVIALSSMLTLIFHDSLIQSQFSGVSPRYYNYSSGQLNSSFSQVEAGIVNGSAVTPGFLIATLTASNATASPNHTLGSQGPTGTPPSNLPSGGGMTRLTM